MDSFSSITWHKKCGIAERARDDVALTVCILSLINAIKIEKDLTAVHTQCRCNDIVPVESSSVTIHLSRYPHRHGYPRLGHHDWNYQSIDRRYHSSSYLHPNPRPHRSSSWGFRLFQACRKRHCESAYGDGPRDRACRTGNFCSSKLDDLMKKWKEGERSAVYKVVDFLWTLWFLLCIRLSLKESGSHKLN